jgi:hypothetical protein
MLKIVWKNLSRLARSDVFVGKTSCQSSAAVSRQTTYRVKPFRESAELACQSMVHEWGRSYAME